MRVCTINKSKVTNVCQPAWKILRRLLTQISNSSIDVDRTADSFLFVSRQGVEQRGLACKFSEVKTCRSELRWTIEYVPAPLGPIIAIKFPLGKVPLTLCRISFLAVSKKHNSIKILITNLVCSFVNEKKEKNLS